MNEQPIFNRYSDLGRVSQLDPII